MLSIYRAGEIDLFENLDIVHIRLLVVVYGVLQVMSLRVGKEVRAPLKELEVLKVLKELSPHSIAKGAGGRGGEVFCVPRNI